MQDFKLGSAVSGDIRVVRPKKSAKITRRNDLILGRHNLSLQEGKLFYWLLSAIKRNDDHFKRYRISIRDFCRLLELRGESAFSSVREISKGMMQRIIEVHDSDEKTWKARPLLTGVEYRYGEGFIDFELHPDLRQYLLNIKGNFTQLQLGIVMQFRSKHGLRLYEILEAELFKGTKIEFEVGEFRALMGIKAGEYDRFNNLRMRAIVPALAEIDKISDLRVRARFLRVGKEVGRIAFLVERRDGYVGDGSDLPREELVRKLRAAGLAEAEAFRAVEKWKDGRNDVDCILWHLAHYQDNHVAKPWAWLRGGLKEDYRPMTAEDWERERVLDKAERALDSVRRRRVHDGSDSQPVGHLLDAVINKYKR